MITGLVSLVVSLAYAPRIADRGASATYRARLNRSVYSSAGRVTFRTLEMETARQLRERAIRCEIYADNNGTRCYE